MTDGSNSKQELEVRDQQKNCPKKSEGKEIVIPGGASSLHLVQIGCTFFYAIGASALTK